MAALCNMAGRHIFALWFLLLSFYLSVFPRLISAVADWMSTILSHMVRIKDADLKHAACVLLKMQDAKNHQKIAIWAPSHTGYIFATKAYIDNRKKTC